VSDEEAAAEVATTEAEVRAQARKVARPRSAPTASRGNPRLRAAQRQSRPTAAGPAGKSDSGNAVSSTSFDHHASYMTKLQAVLAYCAVTSLLPPIIGFYS
jgi:hypothetical protein